MKLNSGEKEPVSMTPEGDIYRFAVGVYDSHRNKLILVREDHTNPKPSEVVNEIVSLDLDGSGKMEVLATGNDFYSNPRLSPDGETLAYITWNHPNMPWDGTQLRTVLLKDDGKLEDDTLVAGE